MRDDAKTKRQLITELVELRDQCQALEKQAEETLHQSETKYRALVESSSDAIVIAQEGKVVFFNARLSEVSGYSREELLSRPYTEFIHPEDRAETLDRYRRRLAGEAVDPKAECRLIDREDRVHWTEFNTSLIEWEGRPATLTAIRDITDRKLAEAALQEAHALLETRVQKRTAELEAANTQLQKEVQERKRAEEAVRFSEERYRTLVEDSFDGIFIQKGPKIIFANQQLYDMLGFEPGELEGLDHWLIYHPDSQELTRTRGQARLRGEEPPPRYEVELQRKDGTSFDGEVSARAFIVEGEPGIQVWVRDISERKRAEEQLRESQERYRFLAENMADIVWTMDLNFQTTYVSPSIEKVLGFTPEERKNQTLEEMLTPESQQRAVTALMTELQQEDQGADPERPLIIEVEYYCRDGSTKWVENSLKALRGPDGALIGMYGSSRDITPRKRVEAEREHLIEQLQEALVNIKTLRGLIPICAHCKKIRDDQGYWQQVEVFVREHSEAQFSHSICPECMKKLYPDRKKS